MTSETCLAAASDLPPRTWHGWWLAWPKWARIGAWAGLGLLASHVFVVLRLFVGQIEDADIQRVRSQQGEVRYFWLPEINPPSRWERTSGYEWLMGGLWGRNRQHVIEVYLPHATDADLRFHCQRFPHLKGVSLHQPNVTLEGLAELKQLAELEGLWFDDSNLGDNEAILLTTIPTLLLLSFEETPVTDALLPHLQRMNRLRVVGLDFTGNSAEAVAAMKATGKWSIDDERRWHVAGNLHGSFRWSDGRRNRHFHGRADVKLEGPLETDNSQTNIKTYPGLAGNHVLYVPRDLHWPAAELAKLPDGDYRFTLKLGDYDSEPVIIRVEDGKPAVQEFVFQMPVTRKEALGDSP